MTATRSYNVRLSRPSRARRGREALARAARRRVLGGRSFSRELREDVEGVYSAGSARQSPILARRPPVLVLVADPARRARPARPPTTSGVLLCMSDETLRPSPRTQAQTLVKAAPGRVDAPHPSPPSKSLSGPQTAYWCSWARTRAPGRTQGLARLVSYVLFEGAVEICVCVGSKRAASATRQLVARGSRACTQLALSALVLQEAAVRQRTSYHSVDALLVVERAAPSSARGARRTSVRSSCDCALDAAGRGG